VPRLRRPAGGLAGLWLVAVLLLASCAHRVPLPDAHVARLPQRVELSDTPFFPQERYQCGPAALATVLVARGVASTPDELVSQVYVPARQGSLQAEMIAAARRQGMLAVVVEPALDAVLEEVAAGHPVLVLQNLGLDWLPRWHYAVVVGYDLAAQELVLRSGTDARRLTQFGVFLKTWDRSARWGIVVLPPGTLPARPDAARYLDAASALEALGQPDAAHAAHAAYQSAVARWPNDAVAWLGLGNTEYARGEHAAAEAAFRRAVGSDPQAFAAWNNLSYALAARGCIRAARTAALCAVRLAPADASETLKEMEALPPPAEEPCATLPDCPLR
jgi:tetratricopeptide (TPR) repeat protein